MKRTSEQIFDELLVLRCQGGDREAMKELIDRWHDRLRRIVGRLTEGHADGEDLTQIVWMTVVRKLGRLKDPATFPQWLYRIATAKCADWTRRRQRTRKMRETVNAELSTTLIEPSGDLKQDRERMVQLALTRMEPEQKTIMTMFYLDEMSVASIAGALGIPVGTVKSRLFHARNELRTQLERSMS